MIDADTQTVGGATTGKAHRTDGTKFFTPRQVADRWAWHVESVRRALRERRIESTIIARRRLVPIAEIERIEAEGRIARVA
jgi:DNA-binding LytR/AlgR family response regulator